MKRFVLKSKIFCKIFIKNVKKHFGSMWEEYKKNKTKKKKNKEKIKSQRTKAKQELKNNKLIEKKDSQKQFIQYTKKLVTMLTIMACLWITTSYVLAAYSLFMFQNTEVLSSLSSTVCTTLVATSLGYMCKSLAESHFEAKINLEHKQLDYAMVTETELTELTDNIVEDDSSNRAD